MSNLKKEIKENKLLTAIVPTKDYKNRIIDIAKDFSSNKKICYVSLSKPYSTVNESLKSRNIDTSSFIFIDAITKGAKTKGEKNAVFISSPELNISIAKILEVGKARGVIFDSLSTLLIYENPTTVSKFVHSLTAKLRAMDVSAVFIVLKEDVNPELLKNLYMFTDKVVDLGKT